MEIDHETPHITLCLSYICTYYFSDRYCSIWNSFLPNFSCHFSRSGVRVHQTRGRGLAKGAGRVVSPIVGHNLLYKERDVMMTLSSSIYQLNGLLSEWGTKNCPYEGAQYPRQKCPGTEDSHWRHPCSLETI
ncbi:hypothetical protein AVEN_260935-1 [Araneus ventricosus]|uniref:Uncharacterized protein n=1 Tax=Araneus ventricosus TaxID=182803 RepID=A0A4Y2MT31_ARAVE|nr:hypothetical protein AVEN_260935-1 [Araneus ventricosus]